MKINKKIHEFAHPFLPHSHLHSLFPPPHPEKEKICTRANALPPERKNLYPQTQLQLVPKNKHGDKILSVYWFAILLIVAGGIFAMVYIFYGTPYDVRGVEARILTNQIADCVSYTGKINSNLISNGVPIGNSEFLNSCHLIFNSSEWTDDQYYTEVSLYKLDNLNTPIIDIKKGNNNLPPSCAIQENKAQERLATCLKSSFYSLDDLNNQYIIKILSIVRKTEKNAKI